MHIEPLKSLALVLHRQPSKIGLDCGSTTVTPMLPTADHIRSLESKPRPLRIEPWVAAHLSRVWQSMKKQIEASIVSDSSTQRSSAQQRTP